MGVDLVFNKRLSYKWMLNGSFTLMSQKVHYGAQGYRDAVNLWAYYNKPSSACLWYTF